MIKEKGNLLRKRLIFFTILFILLIITWWMVTDSSNSADGTKAQKVIFETSMGDITFELATNMPITTGNFIKLVNEGFYDGIVFHRVIKDFMVQGGDPEGTGMGGPGYNIKDEFVAGSTNVRGSISMANTGRPNSGGSQFFLNVADNTFLDWDKEPTSSKHPVFGNVIEGIDVLDKIVNVPTGANDKPTTDVIINKARVL